MQHHYQNTVRRQPYNDLFLFLFSFIRNSFTITAIPYYDSSAEFTSVSSPYLKKLNGINRKKYEEPIILNIG